MRKVAALIVLSVVVYLSSCKSGNTGPNLLVQPVFDSVTKGSYLSVSFNNDTFTVHDLSVNGSGYYTLTGSTVNVAPDSFFSTNIVGTDLKQKKLSINLTAFRDSTTSLGIYYVTNNTSTLTDYTNAANKTYSIEAGSSLTITYAAPNYISGTMALNLHYNHDSTQAVGSFLIYR